MRIPAPFPKEIQLHNSETILTKLKSSSKEPLATFQLTLAESILGQIDIRVKGHSILFQ